MHILRHILHIFISYHIIILYVILSHLRATGEPSWQTASTGVIDCYYNVTDLPPAGAFRFRVACVNKAGKGPYSNCSAAVSLDSTGNVDLLCDL